MSFIPPRAFVAAKYFQARDLQNGTPFCHFGINTLYSQIAKPLKELHFSEP